MFENSISLLADIHGNRWALEAVLDDIKRKGIKKIINLGDSLYGPLDPVGTAKILIANEIPSILGNEDRIILKSQEESEINPTLQFVLDNINEEILNWLEELKPNSIINNDLFLCHGSPFRDDEYLLEEVHEWGVILKSVFKLIEILSPINQQIILCAHSHIPRMVFLPNGKIIVNPGSVGLQAYFDDKPYPHRMETGTPLARYSIITKNNNSLWIENISVNYDWKSASSTAKENSRSD